MRGNMVFLCVLTLAVPSLVSGQIEGRVTDESGRPIAQAVVELIRADSTLGRVLTDATGFFTLSPHPQATGFRVAALGMAPTTEPLGDLLSRVEIVLYPEPLELPPLETVSAPFQCPEIDDPGARKMWARAMSRYQSVDSFSHLAAEVVEAREGVTWPGDFGEIATLPFGWAEVGGSPSAPSVWSPKVVQERGYARRQEWSSMNGRTEAWDFVPLDLASAYYLATDWFAVLQELGLVQANELGTVIAFCDQRKDEPRISGTLFINPEGSVERVQWKITTPDPEEEAGGELYLRGDSEYFLPSSSVYWRKNSVGKYFQQARRFSPWYLGDTEGWRAVRRARAEARRKEGGG
jgi:hypothetical protein